jgi:hypothetical protein
MTALLTYAPNIMLNALKRFWLRRKLNCCKRGADVSEALADAERRNAAYFRIRAVQIAQELRRLD